MTEDSFNKCILSARATIKRSKDQKYYCLHTRQHLLENKPVIFSKSIFLNYMSSR